MDPQQIKLWIDVVQGLITIAALVLGGFWAWTKFVLERGLLPPSQLEISLETLGHSDAATLIELGVHIHNKGSAALVVSQLILRLRYLVQEEGVGLIDKPSEPAHGHLNFPHPQLLGDVGGDARRVRYGNKGDSIDLGRGEFLVVPYDTFVQPGVDQMFGFTTALPAKASHLLAKASFRYQVRPSALQLWILRVSRKIGVLQYSLHHVSEPHTVEKSFRIEREF